MASRDNTPSDPRRDRDELTRLLDRVLMGLPRDPGEFYRQADELWMDYQQRRREQDVMRERARRSPQWASVLIALLSLVVSLIGLLVILARG